MQNDPSADFCFRIADIQTHDVEETRYQLQTAKADVLKKLHSAAGKVVPIQEFLAKWKIVNDLLCSVLGAVDAIAEVNLCAKIACSVISFIPKKISEQIRLDQEVIDLLDEIVVALDLAPNAACTLRSRCEKSDLHKKTLTRLLEQITECVHFIQSYLKDVKFGKRLLKYLVNDGKTVIQNFRQILKKLRDNFVSEVIASVETSVFRIVAEVVSIGEDVKEVKENIKEVDFNMKLQKLPYGQGTDFDPERGCLPQTRVKILDEIVGWVNDPSSPQVLLLSGQAGSGKSSIAHEIARRFRSLDRLATSYCFVRGKPSSRDCFRFFTTLAHNLCNKYPAFKIALSKVIDKNPGLVEMQAYTTLFESLLREPLKDVCFVGPVFIVVDALDESEDASEVQRRDTLAFHDFLASRLCELPSNFRILITSRPEPDLERAFSELSFVRKMSMLDSELTAGLDGDLLLYMRAKLGKAKGVVEDDFQKLANKAEGNFQWASVACSYIAKPPSGLGSRRCVKRVLQPTLVNSEIALKPLDGLYTTVLERFDMKDRDVCNDFKIVMGQILGAFEPLSVDDLNIFVSSKDDSPDVSDIVEHLGSLLSHVAPSDSALPVAPLHTSFRDYLTDKTRSGEFYISLDNVHDEFALATLKTMRKLKFNICKLETSYLFNSEVLDLNKRIEDNIPSSLLYSCRFWANHLARVPWLNSDVFEELQVFMKKHLLFWLEVLSVKGEVGVAKPALISLQGWMYDNVETEELHALVKDAIAFVRYFGYPIAQSAPHIYLSALPFSPSSSIISKLYTPCFSTLRLEEGGLTKWPALEMTIAVPGVVRGLNCVAWSRDGEYIAAGRYQDVKVWSASTGMPISLSSIKDSANSMTFSPDGRRLAIGTRSGFLIWDLMNDMKKEQWGWLRITAIAFSGDGKQLVLGSDNGKVWLWDSEKADAVGEPFVGHSNAVWEVSFLDQEHIMSRSGFRTVRVWNVRTRECVTRMDVATGTIDSVLGRYSRYSRAKSNFDVCSWSESAEGEEKFGGKDCPIAAFSSDGELVATCSSEHVHVWFAKGSMGGSLAGGPFSHEDGMSLAFSADGRRIASGTDDGTLRVWNVQLVDEDGSESNNRRKPSSVAFMPEGEQIVVGWEDGGVDVLDASTGQEVVRIAEGDNRRGWTSVAVSPNGDRIASTRHNSIWTRTGEIETVATPLNSKSISCVVFSPDSNDLVAYGTHLDVYVLDASTGVLIAGPQNFTASKVFSNSMTSLALSPSITNGSTTMKIRVAVGTKQGLFVWDTLTGDVVRFTKDFCSISALVFSSDGKYITSVADGITLCVWDSSNGEVVRGPVNQERLIYGGPSNALSLDGRKVAMLGLNNTVLLLDVVYQGDSDVVLHSSVPAGNRNSYAFSRDAQYFATMSNDRTIRIWDLRAFLKHKQVLDDLASDGSEVVNLVETWIDKFGWAGNPRRRRLFWVPEIHRDGLYRSSNVRVVGRQFKETRLDLENFVHGKNWEKCWLNYAQVV